MTLPHTFASQTGPIPLSELDDNFNALAAAIVAGIPVIPGLIGDGLTDNSGVIAAAYAALPSTGGVLLFPEGVFNYNSQLLFNSAKPLVLMGAGMFATVLQPTFAGGDSILVNGPTKFFIGDLSINSTVARTSGTYLVHVMNCVYPGARDVWVDTPRGGLWMFESCNFLNAKGLQGDSNDNVGGNTGLRIKSCGGTLTNVYLRVGPIASGGYTNSQPCLWITGQTTSLEITNSSFSGGGPHSVFSIAGITSTGANFTVNVLAHDFNAGDFFAIRGASVAAYNNAWRIASVTTNTVVVTTTLNPGTATAQGTAESLAACCLISNENGAVNECRMDNVIFEALQPNVYGSVGLYFDGRRGPVGSAREISGWNLGTIYCDFGTIGAMFTGKALSVANDPSCFAITIASLKAESTCCAFHVEGAQNITINGFIGNSNQAPSTDRIHLDVTGAPRPMEFYLAAGLAAPYTQGININNCNIGMEGNYSSLNESRSKDYGVFLAGLGAGAANLQDIVIQGNNIYGRALSITDDGSALFATTRLKCENNQLSFTGIGSNLIPSSASGNTTNIFPYNDVVQITGTTNIQFINPAYDGHEVKLIFSGALSLLSGGNLAIAANYNVLAGQLVMLVFNGTSWFVK